MAYYEHPDYVPLLRCAFDGWKRLEVEPGDLLFHVSGGVYACPSRCDVVERSAESVLDGRVIIVCGFSGHGFKFAPAIGGVIAQITAGEPRTLPIGFLGLERFDGE